MIDIHCHLLYGVDDGAQTIEDTKKLLADAVQQGIDTIVLTPHFRKGMFEASEKTIQSHYQQVKALAQQQYPTVTLLLGREIYCHHDILQDFSPSWTFEETNVVLLEFRRDASFIEINNCVVQFLERQYHVVIAHIERYQHLTINDIQQLKNLGCTIQVNASHVDRIKLFDSNKERKKFIHTLLTERIVDIIASDTHNLTTRKNEMKRAYDYIKKEYSALYARKLFINNPQKILYP